MLIPRLRYGELPAGTHIVTIDDIERVFGSQNDRRKKLMRGLKKAAEMFKNAGVRFILVDGSFTTDKEEPGDIDGCWSGRDVNFEKIDSNFWDFNTAFEFQEKRKIIKETYGLDFFIAEMFESESGKPFSDFFQTSKEGYLKGILKIELN